MYDENELFLFTPSSHPRHNRSPYWLLLGSVHVKYQIEVTPPADITGNELPFEGPPVEKVGFVIAVFQPVPSIALGYMHFQWYLI